MLQESEFYGMWIIAQKKKIEYSMSHLTYGTTYYFSQQIINNP